MNVMVKVEGEKEIKKGTSEVCKEEEGKVKVGRVRWSHGGSKSLVTLMFQGKGLTAW